MLYEELMMDTSMKIRYSMFRLLTTLAKEHYSIFFIAQKLNLTYQQTYHHLNELNREIQQANPKQHSILIKNSGINTGKLLLSLDEYRYFLLQSSIPFRFMQYITNENTPSLERFCDEMFISRSTLSRKIKPLTEFLHQFNIRISYTTMSLVGDETKIRLLLFYLMWLGTRGIVWPFAFPKSELEFFKKRFTRFFSLDTTFVGKKELEFFLAVSYGRMKRHFYVDYNPKYDFLFANSTYFDLTLLNDYPNISLQNAKGESAHFYFLSLFAPYFSDEKDPVLEATLDEFSKNDNPIWNLATQFIRYMEKHLFTDPLTKEQQHVLLGNLLHTGFAYYIFEGPFPNMHSFLFSEKGQGTTHALDAACQTFFKSKLNTATYAAFKGNLKSLSLAYKRIIAPYFLARQEKHKLHVALAIEQNHFFIQQLVNFLDSLNFVSFETFVEDPEKYDLIIASSFALKKENPDLPFYYWDLDFNYEELIYLYQTLRQLYVYKNE